MENGWGTDVQDRNGGGLDHAGSEGEKGAQRLVGVWTLIIGVWGSDYMESGDLPTEGDRGLG